MTMLIELTRRAVSHPHMAAFVKRAVTVQNGEGDKIEIPTWGIVVVYLTVAAGSIGFTLVSTPCPCRALPSGIAMLMTRLCTDNVLLVVVHAQPRHYNPVHG